MADTAGEYLKPHNLSGFTAKQTVKSNFILCLAAASEFIGAKLYMGRCNLNGITRLPRLNYLLRTDGWSITSVKNHHHQGSTEEYK